MYLVQLIPCNELYIKKSDPLFKDCNALYSIAKVLTDASRSGLQE